MINVEIFDMLEQIPTHHVDIDFNKPITIYVNTATTCFDEDIQLRDIHVEQHDDKKHLPSYFFNMTEYRSAADFPQGVRYNLIAEKVLLDRRDLQSYCKFRLQNKV